MYTDASKEGDYVGYSWLASIEDFIIEEKIFSAREINIYQAEMLAIKEALEWASQNSEPERDIKNLSDSLSAFTILNGHTAANQISLETLNLLDSLQSRTHIRRYTVCWVKGHNDTTGNETADALARQGMMNARSLAYCTPFLPTSYGEFNKNRLCSKTCGVN